MQLTDEQKQQVSEWVRNGAGLSEVQKKLSAEFGISLTYMDVRFLILDLGVSLKDKEVPKPKPQPVAAPATMPDAHVDGDMPDAFREAPAEDAFGDLPPEGAGPAGVRVDLDRVMKPGAIASGTATFSDGITASWSLDQFGRLALVPPRPGYQPTPADVQSFQLELRRVLERRGF